MRRILLSIGMATAVFFTGVAVCPAKHIVSLTTLIDMNQDQTLIQTPLAGLFPARPAFSHSVKLAKVHFVVDKSDKIGFDDIDQSYDVNNTAKCNAAGFKTAVSACSGNYVPGRVCPYDTNLTDRCCNRNYSFERGKCFYPKSLSSDTCGGKYKCTCDTALYPYSSSNCTAPHYLSGEKCSYSYTNNGSVTTYTYYTECLCPANYKTCNAGQKQVGIGTVCRFNGQDLYAACECKSGYNQTCRNFGPINASDYCLLSGIQYYNACKTCPNKGTLNSCPTGFACSLEQCSAKYYITGCASGYTDISSCLWKRCFMPSVTSP